MFNFGSIWRVWWFPLVCFSAAGADYSSSIRHLEELLNHQVRNGEISGVSIALVDDQSIIWNGAFGFADKSKKQPVTRQTVFRAGSISKLFTAMGAMQLAEQNKLDIDRPVAEFYPGFQIIIPFPAGAITLRQLMCHRSGLIRESPVGGYFDDKQPTPEQTVASIASCVLVHPPGSKTKYSNIGVTVVGQAVAKVSRQSFADYAAERMLRPLAMTNSAFLLNDDLRKGVAQGYMAVAQPSGNFKEIEAPWFELGTIPAGNLYTTAEDLARLMSCLFAHGKAGNAQIVTHRTLDEMFTPQLTKEQTGYGLGFHIGLHNKRKKVSHTGAVYGFTSSFAALPNEKMGVIVLINDDLATGPIRHITDLALDLLLHDKKKEPLPASPESEPIPAETLKRFAGEYLSDSFWAHIELRGERLHANISGQRVELMPAGKDRFHAHGRTAWRTSFAFETSDGQATAFTALGQRFELASGKVKSIPREWEQLLGSYGPSFIPLIISYKYGHLWAMTENEYDYRLTPINRYDFKMPPGLYTDEQLVFQTSQDGKAHTAVLANMRLARRSR